MTPGRMTSLQRVLTTMEHKEPDRVPCFLLVTMHGSKELGISIEEYFSKAEYVVEGQLRIQKKYRNDLLYPFFYGAAEVEAWGGEVIYVEDGPPNAGRPFIHTPEDIKSLTPPIVKESACLVKTLQAIDMLKSKTGDEFPIIGVAVSPFSLPAMQMGLGKYLDLIYERPELFDHLMTLNEHFCAEWANAQLEAGAHAIVYYDAVSSTTIIPRELYLKTGQRIATRTLARIHGPTVTHGASGNFLTIVDDLAQTGTAGIGVSSLEDLSQLKAVCQGKLTIVGNLNGIEMRNWTATHAETMVKDAIAKAGPGGGFILSDNHGEIPYQVPERVLLAVSDAVRAWGTYPLDWVKDDGR